MSIINIQRVSVGAVGVSPGEISLLTDDGLATITAPGYLSNNTAAGNLSPLDIVKAIYLYDPFTGGTFGLFTISTSNGVNTLTPWVDSGNVLLPVSAGHVPVFNGTNGQIKDSGAAMSNNTNPFFVTALDNQVVNTLGVIYDTHGSIRSITKGTVTESGSGTIVLVAESGVITTSSLTTAGGSSYVITWTNSYIKSSSVILLTAMGGTNTNKSFLLQATPGSGTATLTIYNNTGLTAFNGTIIIGFAIL